MMRKIAISIERSVASWFAGQSNRILQKRNWNNLICSTSGKMFILPALPYWIRRRSRLSKSRSSLNFALAIAQSNFVGTSAAVMGLLK